MRHSNPLLALLLRGAAVFLLSMWRPLWAQPAAEGRAAVAVEQNAAGVAHMNRFLYREAVEEFRKALEGDSDFNLARINLGIALLYNQEVDQAQLILEEALAREPGNPYANFSLGLTFRNKGLEDQAEARFKRVVEIDPECATAYYNLGVVYARKRKANEAEAAFRHALALDPANAASLYNLGSLLAKQGRTQEGQEFLEKFRALQPAAEINAGMGSGPQYGKAGKYALARDDTSRYR